jgi:hypothetical protein
MKKIILGILLGFIAGAATIWLVLRHPAEAAHEKQPAEMEQHEAGLHLTKEQQASAGFLVAKPEAMELKPETKAFGRVLDAAPLATLLAEIQTAQSSLNATVKEFERLKSLGENASPRSLETAEAAMKRDQAAQESAQARLLAGWGKPFTSRADLAALTRSLLTQEAALVRVDLLAGELLPSEPRAVRIVPLTGDASAREAELLGPAPTADPQAQGQAFLALIRDHAPPPGTTLAAWLVTDGAAQRGFRLPRTAVVQYENGLFVFMQTGDTVFERKRVQVAKSQRDGVFVVSGIGADDRVVMTGAQQLLSEELKGAGGE